MILYHLTVQRFIGNKNIRSHFVHTELATCWRNGQSKKEFRFFSFIFSPFSNFSFMTNFFFRSIVYYYLRWFLVEMNCCVLTMNYVCFLVFSDESDRFIHEKYWKLFAFFLQSIFSLSLFYLLSLLPPSNFSYAALISSLVSSRFTSLWSSLFCLRSLFLFPSIQTFHFTLVKLSFRFLRPFLFSRSIFKLFANLSFLFTIPWHFIYNFPFLVRDFYTFLSSSLCYHWSPLNIFHVFFFIYSFSFRLIRLTISLSTSDIPFEFSVQLFFNAEYFIWCIRFGRFLRFLLVFSGGCYLILPLVCQIICWTLVWRSDAFLYSTIYTCAVCIAVVGVVVILSIKSVVICRFGYTFCHWLYMFSHFSQCSQNFFSLAVECYACYFCCYCCYWLHFDNFLLLSSFKSPYAAGANIVSKVFLFWN